MKSITELLNRRQQLEEKKADLANQTREILKKQQKDQDGKDTVADKAEIFDETEDLYQQALKQRNSINSELNDIRDSLGTTEDI